MCRPFFASVFLMGLGITGVAADGLSPEQATWRWTMSRALDAQRGPDKSTLAAQGEFSQRYTRYSLNGQIEQGR